MIYIDNGDIDINMQSIFTMAECRGRMVKAACKIEHHNAPMHRFITSHRLMVQVKADKMLSYVS